MICQSQAATKTENEDFSLFNVVRCMLLVLRKVKFCFGLVPLPF